MRAKANRIGDAISAIPSFFVAGNLQPQICILIPRYSSCESCGTGFCVSIIADEGASFQKPHFRSLDLTLKGQKVPKTRHFQNEGIHEDATGIAQGLLRSSERARPRAA